MTAKEFVKDKYPNAYAEKQMEGKVKGLQTPYFLIRNGNSSGYIASGKTESSAWVNAKKNIRKIMQ